eukprot:m.48652 g.48652  ORF g.48652 m.48652 type:complete len:87 (-) comp10846_c0_seq6:1102-1362(-)
MYWSSFCRQKDYTQSQRKKNNDSVFCEWYLQSLHARTCGVAYSISLLRSCSILVARKIATKMRLSCFLCVYVFVCAFVFVCVLLLI